MESAKGQVEAVSAGNLSGIDQMWVCVAFIAFVDIVWISTEI
uniref:Uncharacterized protein n=1 Tax=Agrobacterium tumefaciens TaxID=358 RepID=K7WN71_AGRTU|nr:Hypothetical protein [Agrobacterium radiobacter]